MELCQFYISELTNVFDAILLSVYVQANDQGQAWAELPVGRVPSRGEISEHKKRALLGVINLSRTSRRVCRFSILPSEATPE